MCSYIIGLNSSTLDSAWACQARDDKVIIETAIDSIGLDVLFSRVPFYKLVRNFPLVVFLFSFHTKPAFKLFKLNRIITFLSNSKNRIYFAWEIRRWTWTESESTWPQPSPRTRIPRFIYNSPHSNTSSSTTPSGHPWVIGYNNCGYFILPLKTTGFTRWTLERVRLTTRWVWQEAKEEEQVFEFPLEVKIQYWWRGPCA